MAKVSEADLKRWRDWQNDHWYYHEGKPWRGPPPKPVLSTFPRLVDGKLTCGCEKYCKGHGGALYRNGEPVRDPA